LELLQRTADICHAAVREAIHATLRLPPPPASSSWHAFPPQPMTTLDPAPAEQYPLLRSMMEQICRKATQALMDQAQEQLEFHLRAEKHPYTQDQVLLENIAAARYRSLRLELEMALRLDMAETMSYSTTAAAAATSMSSSSSTYASSSSSVMKGFGGNASVAAAATPLYDAATIRSVLDAVFARHQEHKSVEDHVAEEMELILASYGEIATRRVLDRTPMIGWDVLRSLANAVQERLLSHEITDEDLSQCLHQESASMIRCRERYDALQQEVLELDKALQLFDSL